MTTATKPYIGYVITDDGMILAQTPSGDPRFRLTLHSDDQSWDFGQPGFCFSVWHAIADDDPRITDERREGLQWIIDEARAAQPES